jgi:hypothetical protein
MILDLLPGKQLREISAGHPNAPAIAQVDSPCVGCTNSLAKWGNRSPMRPASGGWWLVAGGWWLVAGGWWLEVAVCERPGT